MFYLELGLLLEVGAGHVGQLELVIGRQRGVMQRLETTPIIQIKEE